MTSTLVHLALAALIAGTLLGDEFDERSLLVVLAATAVIDLDVVAGWWLPGGHRSVLHNVFVPGVAAAALYWDTHREESWVLSRWGARGRRVGWTSVVCVALAGIGLDLVTGGANLFYPLHDQFYQASGKLVYSTQDGIVQTFVEGAERGSSSEVHVRSGVDPTPGEESADVDRIFPVAYSAMELLVLVVGTVTAGVRLWETRRETRGE